MLGAPGSGKGTQAQVLAMRLGVPHISTGEIFREHKTNRTALGIQVESIMARGDLVPDAIVNEIVKDRLGRDDCRQTGFILDGYPRTVAQAEEVGRWLDAAGMPLTGVVELDVDPEILVKRLSGRRRCAGCGKDYNVMFKPPRVEGRCDVCNGELVTRADDQPDAIRRRLEIDAAQARPLHDFYAAKGVLVSFDGARDVTVITEEILKRLVTA